MACHSHGMENVLSYPFKSPPVCNNKFPRNSIWLSPQSSYIVVINCKPKPHHFPGPNRPPSSRFGSSHEHAFQSHPCLNISVPHQLNPSIQPGYTNPKNTTTSPNARLASSAADNVIVYLPHHAPARRRSTWLKMKHTMAHAEKLSPVYLISLLSLSHSLFHSPG